MIKSKTDHCLDHQQPIEEALLHYEILQKLENFMVLKIDLISGRKHQIRAQLAAIGCPIRAISNMDQNVRTGCVIDLHTFVTVSTSDEATAIKIVAPFLRWFVGTCSVKP
jgi:hypothetical protein